MLSGPRAGANSPPMTAQAATYLSEAQWSGVHALAGVAEPFKPVIDDLEQNFEGWMECTRRRRDASNGRRPLLRSRSSADTSSNGRVPAAALALLR